MFGISHGPELIALIVIALVIFGPKRIPEIGSSLGKGIKEFKKSTQDDDSSASTQQLSSAHQPGDVHVSESSGIIRDREAG